MVASIEFSTMPIEAVSCSRKAICSSVKSLSEASSITALTWPSNSTGSTMMLLGGAVNRPDVIGRTDGGMSEIRIWRRSAAHWPIRPSPMRSISGWRSPTESA